MAMAVAALGGLLTHTPLTTALNAMAGVKDAFDKGDQVRINEGPFTSFNGVVDEVNLDRKPGQASADSGYLSEANLAALAVREIDGYIATGRAKHPTVENGKAGGPLTQAMRKKIAAGGFDTPYRLRKQIVEAVFGQI